MQESGYLEIQVPEEIKVLNNAVNVEEFLFNREMRQKIRQELNVR